MTDTITYIPLSALRESPFNPRKVFPAEALQELADSIATQGLLQPIVARPLPMTKKDLHFTYEIVFGHRRFRAATMAKLEHVPVIVKEMSDKDAAIKQMHENIQRKDPTAIEEADGFLHLHSVHKMKPDDIAKAIGKSRSYVYGRIKLAKAAPEVRTAAIEQGLSPESALDLARLPHHDLQRAGLKMIRDAFAETKERPVVWCSVREAARRLGNNFSINLDEAPFDLMDATIAARAGACTACPRRAGNDPDLAAVLAANICTDKTCYDIKVKEARRLEVEGFRADGHTVYAGDEAKDFLPHWWVTPRGMVDMEETAFEMPSLDPENPTAIDWFIAITHLGSDSTLNPKRVVVDFPGGDRLRHFITEATAAEILAALGRAPEGGEGASTPSMAARARIDADEDDDVDDLPIEIRAVSWGHWEKVQAVILERAVARKERTGAELRIVACALLQDRDTLPDEVVDAMGWRAEVDAINEADDSVNEEEWAIDRLPTMSDAEVAKLLVALAIACAPARYGHAGNVEKLALAAEYGVDVVKAAGLEQKDDAGDAGGSDGQADLLEEAGA